MIHPRRLAGGARRARGPALLTALLAAAAVAAAASPARAQSDEAVAQLRYEQGLELYDARSYEEALAAFRASLETIPSPNSRLYVARCLRHLGRTAEAVVEYHLTAQEAADRAALDRRYTQTRRAAEREGRALEPRVGWITLDVSRGPAAEGPPPELQVSFGGRAIPSAALGLALPADPGLVEIRVEAPGYEPVTQEVTVRAGARESVAIELREVVAPPVEPVVFASPEPQRPVAPPGRHRGLFAASLVMLGVSVASAAAFVALAVVTDQQYADLVAQCGDLPCPGTVAPDVERGRDLSLGVDVTFGATLATAAAAIALGAVAVAVDRRRAGAARGVALRGTSLAIRW